MGLMKGWTGDPAGHRGMGILLTTDKAAIIAENPEKTGYFQIFENEEVITGRTRALTPTKA
jgi:hypothetical protein